MDREGWRFGLFRMCRLLRALRLCLLSAASFSTLQLFGSLLDSEFGDQLDSLIPSIAVAENISVEDGQSMIYMVSSPKPHIYT